MFDDGEFGLHITTGPENLLKLLECRTHLYDNETLMDVMDTIINLELKAMYIDTWNSCMPIIDKHNKRANEHDKKVVSLRPVDKKGD